MRALKYNHDYKLFGLFDVDPLEAKAAGFKPSNGRWVTPNPYAALNFIEIASPDALLALGSLGRAVKASLAADSSVPIPSPEGCEYLPFQRAGIVYAAARPNCLIGDEPGLGKTIQAIGLANYLGLKRLLIVCPAGLRLNWAREMKKWHLNGAPVQAVISGKEQLSNSASIVISYDLAVRYVKHLFSRRFDMVVCDEGHYLKNPQAARTKIVLGRRNIPGLLATASRRVVLTGTPVPNRINEIYPLIRTLCPAAIDGMTYGQFLSYFAHMIRDGFSEKVVGVKREGELYARLRAHLMVRRVKADVLKDLPPKRFKLVVFPADGAVRKVLVREKQFSAREIIRYGVPVGSALPEIRREMGVAKAPQVVRYVDDMFSDGVKKVVVFAHHRDVVSILEAGLKKYGVVVVTGSTSQRDRQAAVDKFQSDPNVRVFLGNIIAAGTGITLTASSDVVFAEADWVPGNNEQAADRCHRVGQQDSVLVHYLVAEGSLDAAILGSAVKKEQDIRKVLDKA